MSAEAQALQLSEEPNEPEEIASATDFDGDQSGPWSLRRLLIALDALAVTTAWGLTLLPAAIQPGSSPDRDLRLAAIWAATAAAAMVVIASQRLYRARVCSVKAVETARLGRVALISGVTALTGAQLLSIKVPLVSVMTGAVASFLLLVAFRGAFRSWLTAGRRQGRFSRPVLIVGLNDEASDLYHLIRDHAELGLRVVGLIGRPNDYSERLDAPVLGDFRHAARAARASGANGALVAPSAMSPDELNAVVRDLLDDGLHVHVSSGLRGIAHRRVRTVPLAHEPFLYLEQASLSRWQLVSKRALDLVIGCVAFLLVAPVLAIAALAIRLHDGGPVLFRQQRVGRDGKLFTLYKLRTMIPDAESRLEALRALNQRSEGPLFKLAADPRVTAVGRILRATSIDELPQLLNVIEGTMSLVGPRPALPHEVEQFDDRLRSRARVLPGITGLWQVEARDNPSFRAYQRLDLFYVDNWSVGLDLSILLTTAGVVASRGLRAIRSKLTLHDPQAVPGTLD